MRCHVRAHPRGRLFENRYIVREWIRNRGASENVRWRTVPRLGEDWHPDLSEFYDEIQVYGSLLGCKNVDAEAVRLELWRLALQIQYAREIVAEEEDWPR